MKKNLVFILFSIMISGGLYAQDTLPHFDVTQMGRKVLVSWTNPYANVTHINIQRSGDSVKNFNTIGTVLNVAAPVNGFVDPKEFIPSTQYYRLFIAFEGGSYLFTEAHQPGPPDTSKSGIDLVKKVIIKEKVEPIKKNRFVPSIHVYTGKNHNVIISLPDVTKYKYSLKFYEDNGTFLFKINHVTENYLILDKVNFGHSGLFRFELLQNRLPIEIHKVYIPKDGEPMPRLDSSGYEIQ